MAGESTDGNQRVNFVEWMAAHGGIVHPHLNLFAQLPNDDRGVIAKAAISKGEKLLLIPKDLCMTVPTGEDIAASAATAPEAGPSSRALATLDPQPSNFMATVLLLMAEKAAMSRYAPYLATLPPSHNSLVTWTDQQLSLLNGTALEDRGGKRCPEIYTQEVLPIITSHASVWPLEACDLEAFTWALGMVQSRAFHLSSATDRVTGSSDSSNNTCLYLIPAVDMLNHSSSQDRRCTELQLIKVGPAIQGAAAPREFFYMEAQRDIAKGEEILHSYGDLSDAQLLHTFGFVELVDGSADGGSIDINPHNTVHVPMELVVECAGSLGRVSDQELEERLEVLRSAGLLDVAREVPLKNPLSDALLTVVQVLLMDRKGFEVYRKELQKSENDDGHGSNGLLGAGMMEVNSELMGAVCMTLLKAVHTALKQIPPSITIPSGDGSAVSVIRAKFAAQLNATQRAGLELLKGQLAEMLCAASGGSDEGSSSGSDDAEDSLNEDSDDDLQSFDDEEEEVVVEAKQKRRKL